MGGGGFSLWPDNGRLDQFLIGLARERAGHDRPRVCFIPTARADDPSKIADFYETYAGRADASVLRLFDREIVDIEAHLRSQDLVFVVGGNTANMLAIWRLHGVDRAMRAAWEDGVVMSGVSAGGICWFEACTTDSFGPELQPLRRRVRGPAGLLRAALRRRGAATAAVSPARGGWDAPERLWRRRRGGPRLPRHGPRRGGHLETTMHAPIASSVPATRRPKHRCQRAPFRAAENTERQIGARWAELLSLTLRTIRSPRHTLPRGAREVDGPARAGRPYRGGRYLDDHVVQASPCGPPLGSRARHAHAPRDHGSAGGGQAAGCATRSPGSGEVRSRPRQRRSRPARGGGRGRQEDGHAAHRRGARSPRRGCGRHRVPLAAWSVATDAAVDYLKVEVPTARAEQAAAVDAIAAVDVDGLILLDDPRPDGAESPLPQTPPERGDPAKQPVPADRRHGRSAVHGCQPDLGRPRRARSRCSTPGVDLDHPALATTTTGEPKIVDWYNANAPNSGDGTWVSTTGRFNGVFTATGATWTAPATGGPYSLRAAPGDHRRPRSR